MDDLAWVYQKVDGGFIRNTWGSELIAAAGQKALFCIRLPLGGNMDG